ncbi:MAG: metallophosphoesterase [Nanoarchaeota archaeon]
MLKVAVISDTHLGFAYGTERQDDSFINFEQAFNNAVREQPQAILLGGDIFHDRIPKQEILGRAIELFTKMNRVMKKKLTVIRKIKDGKVELEKYQIPPIIAIWGTHERRHKGSTNPVQILEKAGLLYCLHAESILLEIDTDKLGVHGLSGVPEPYAKDTLRTWSPAPFKEGPNILMIHQNFKEIMPPVEHYLEFKDLPKDFNVYLLGHIHNTSQNKHPISKNPIITVGSTVSTQMQKSESETEKGLYVLEFGRLQGGIKFIPINTRKLIYEDFDITGNKPSDVYFKLAEKIDAHLKKRYELKPMVRIRLVGKLPDGFSPEDIKLSKLIKEYSDKCIISLDKSKISSSELEKGSQLLQDIKQNKFSVDKVGLEILSRSLRNAVSQEKLHNLFELLSVGELEKAEQELNSGVKNAQENKIAELESA